MPYISPETVKEMRIKLKKKLPQFKLSVRTENYSSVCVTLVSGPVDFGTKYTQVNNFYINEHWTGDRRTVLNAIQNIIGKGCGVEVEDGDYGSVPDWYTRIHIGRWDKDYVVTKKSK